MLSLRTYVHDRGGAAAVEFALVAVLAIMSILFIMTVATILFLNQALDYATTRAARQILTGAAQGGALDQASFKASLCGYLPAALKCSNLVVNLYVVTPGTSPSGYYAYVKSDVSGLLIPSLTPSSGQYTLGTRGQYQYLLVIYPITFLPSAFASILGGGATYNGAPAYLTISTAAFRNELF
ncbi:TadE/TadG family type IV pilus assembly protein [Methylobacterium sp. NEAU K]|uniref:TadE/TadG family type IV pilus assembly protein n=1 Tax=Methylobacterium sp. NEAU K TaxID=3064946 RepID=UPI0027337D19|nr:TadE/TadG family type IV pilus assembly protein [Methylobacterium sp. NEAU K]MDP4002063.1 TadE/TadG family type IV pilus assembly protein [Methylobacterium sp. NEAU K]